MTYREVLEIRRRIPEGGWQGLPGVSVRAPALRNERAKREGRSVLLPMQPEPDPPGRVEWVEWEAAVNRRGIIARRNSLKPAMSALENFVNWACSVIGASPKEVRSKSRRHDIARQRHAIMAAARMRQRWSLAEIAMEFGRGHAVTVHAMKKAKQCPKVGAMVERIQNENA